MSTRLQRLAFTPALICLWLGGNSIAVDAVFRCDGDDHLVQNTPLCPPRTAQTVLNALAPGAGFMCGTPDGGNYMHPWVPGCGRHFNGHGTANSPHLAALNTALGTTFTCSYYGFVNGCTAANFNRITVATSGCSQLGTYDPASGVCRCGTGRSGPTCQHAAPTPAPSTTPSTSAPTAAPTPRPSRAPMSAPTAQPTPAPTTLPSSQPTPAPTTLGPTQVPTLAAVWSCGAGTVLTSTPFSNVCTAVCGEGTKLVDGACIPDCADLRRRDISCTHCNDGSETSTEDAGDSDSESTGVIVGVAVGILVGLGLASGAFVAMRRSSDTDANHRGAENPTYNESGAKPDSFGFAQGGSEGYLEVAAKAK